MTRPILWYFLKEQISFLSYTFFYKWKHFLKKSWVERKEKVNENKKGSKLRNEGDHRALST